jgi:hypothetical protein
VSAPTQAEKDAAFHAAMQHCDDCANGFCHPVMPCREGARLLREAARVCGIGIPDGRQVDQQTEASDQGTKAAE